MTRKALVVGIDHYPNIKSLTGCVNDARKVKGVLGRHHSGEKNFDVNLVIGSDPAPSVARTQLKDLVEALFVDDNEVALFYFAGHGWVESSGGYLCTSDSNRVDEGLSLDEVMKLARGSKANNNIIILDSCHSGAAGVRDGDKTVELTKGMTILTASTEVQQAMEVSGTGVFTDLLVDALDGAAANLVGEVTPGAVYAHIDQSLGRWGQRPVFRTNVQGFVSLRRARPPIERSELLRLTEFFPTSGFSFRLDPTFEPHRSSDDAHLPAPDPVNTAVFKILQRFNRVGVLVPQDVEHMYDAAMTSRGCRLTALGEHYRRLVETDRI